MGIVPSAEHQHIDMCYALRPRAGVPRIAPEADHGFLLVSAEQLRRDEHLPVAACGVDMPIAEDVRVLGLRSIALVRDNRAAAE